MRYLVTTQHEPPFRTFYFQSENHWRDGVGMVVYDLKESMYTKDGKTWRPIHKDAL